MFLASYFLASQIYSALGGVVLAANLFNVDRRLWIFHVQRFKVLDDNARDGQIAEPFVIGRNDEPGRMRRAATGERVFIGGHIILPESALLIVGLADLPVFGGVVETILEALQLFFF